MESLSKIKNSLLLQYVAGIGTIIFISFTCYLFFDLIGYHVVALILLLVVSILAMFLDTLPIVLVAILSALIWNFFFIQPQATFNIHTPQDALLFLMYFIIAVMNAIFTSRVRKMEHVAQQRKEREKTLQLYNTLFNSLSHELKTPISTIIGAVDTLQTNSKNLSELHKAELLVELNIAGDRLHRQVNNLLNMSRLETDFLKLQLDWYDINEIVQGVIDNNRKSVTQQHEIVFHSNQDLPLFKVDGLLIEQILHNIIHNAILHTPPATTINVAVHFKDEILEITIADNGNGFPEDKLDTVFNKFYRLPNSSTGGTGLGLSIAKGFAKAHNGTIKLENQQTSGAIFTVIIPTETMFLENEL